MFFCKSNYILAAALMIMMKYQVLALNIALKYYNFQ